MDCSPLLMCSMSLWALSNTDSSSGHQRFALDDRRASIISNHSTQEGNWKACAAPVKCILQRHSFYEQAGHYGAQLSELILPGQVALGPKLFGVLPPLAIHSSYKDAPKPVYISAQNNTFVSMKAAPSCLGPLCFIAVLRISEVLLRTFPSPFASYST